MSFPWIDGDMVAVIVCRNTLARLNFFGLQLAAAFAYFNAAILGNVVGATNFQKYLLAWIIKIFRIAIDREGNSPIKSAAGGYGHDESRLGKIGRERDVRYQRQFVELVIWVIGVK